MTDLFSLIVIGLGSFLIIATFTMSGGIGLIMRPLIMFMGVPPQITIACARASAIPGNILFKEILDCGIYKWIGILVNLIGYLDIRQQSAFTDRWLQTWNPPFGRCYMKA